MADGTFLLCLDEVMLISWTKLRSFGCRLGQRPGDVGPC